MLSPVISKYPCVLNWVVQISEGWYRLLSIKNHINEELLPVNLLSVIDTHPYVHSKDIICIHFAQGSFI